MAKSRVQGIVVEIGGNTTGLEKALKDVNSEIYSTAGQLRDVERLLKLDPGNTELLRQRQRLLGQEVEQTAEKLQALKTAEKQVQQQFREGKASQEQYEALQREIIATDRKLDGLKSEAKDADRALENIDDDSLDEVTRSAKQAEEALSDAGKEAADFGDVLSADLIADGAGKILDGIGNLSEETREYRKIMGTLKTSSEASGYTAEETAEAYDKLYGVLGDEQSAATTLANLQALGLSQDDLLQVIKGSTGAWAKYGDSIPIDGLAEAINETIRTGKVTGTFADVLNWAGKSEDEFNQQLQDCWREADRVNLVMQEMADQGLTDAADAWEENNQSIVEYNDAQSDLQEELAKVGELVEPMIAKLVSGISKMLKWFNNLPEGVKKTIVVLTAVAAAIGPVLLAFKGLKLVFGTLQTVVLPGLAKAFSSFVAFIVANPVVLLIAAVVLVVTTIAAFGDQIQQLLQRLDNWLQNVFATDWTNIFGPILGEGLNVFFANVKNIWAAVKQVFDGIIDFIRGVFTGDWERAWSGIKEIFAGIWHGLVGIAKVPINAIIGLMNGMINGVNWMIEKINSISWENPFTGTVYGFNIGYIGNIPYLARGGQVLQGSAVVGEAGPELLTVANGRTVVQPLGRSGDTPRPVAAAAGSGGTNLVFNQTINSPQNVQPYEAYRLARNAGRQIVREIKRVTRK